MVLVNVFKFTVILPWTDAALVCLLQWMLPAFFSGDEWWNVDAHSVVCSKRVWSCGEMSKFTNFWNNWRENECRMVTHLWKCLVMHFCSVEWLSMPLVIRDQGDIVWVCWITMSQLLCQKICSRAIGPQVTLMREEFQKLKGHLVGNQGFVDKVWVLQAVSFVHLQQCSHWIIPNMWNSFLLAH